MNGSCLNGKKSNVQFQRIIMIDYISRPEEEWKKELTKEQYEVMRRDSLEIPYTGEYLTTVKRGIYSCVGCGTPLFSSKTKFDHGSGWACFSDTIQEDLLGTRSGTRLGVEQTEVFCNICKSHIGHVFKDGPVTKNEGTRYGVNSCALTFKKSERR